MPPKAAPVASWSVQAIAAVRVLPTGGGGQTAIVRAMKPRSGSSSLAPDQLVYLIGEGEAPVHVFISGVQIPATSRSMARAAGLPEDRELALVVLGPGPQPACKAGTDR